MRVRFRFFDPARDFEAIAPWSSAAGIDPSLLPPFGMIGEHAGGEHDGMALVVAWLLVSNGVGYIYAPSLNPCVPDAARDELLVKICDMLGDEAFEAGCRAIVAQGVNGPQDAHFERAGFAHACASPATTHAPGDPGAARGAIDGLPE